MRRSSPLLLRSSSCVPAHTPHANKLHFAKRAWGIAWVVRRTRAGYPCPMPSDRPSNLGKTFWPDEGLTKGDLLAYLDAAAPALLSALRDRPLTVIRYPDGLRGTSFFQKNTPAYAPDWVRTIR